MIKCKVEGWTEGRFRAFVFSQIRAGMRRYPPKFECLKKARLKKKLINKASGREAFHFKCNICKGAFPQKEVQVDHIKPVVDPIKGFVDWNTYIERMFCKASNFQVACKPCHKAKTLAEKKRRVSSKS